MPQLLPPLIRGPVSVLTRTVRVQGALVGAKVTLSQDGMPIGAPTAAGPNGVAGVDVSAVTLKASAKLTAVQTSGTDTSDPSPAEPVLGPPATLAPLAFLTQIHTCIDGVILGGTVDGATVEVTHQGNVLGHAVAVDPQLSLHLQHQGSLPTGAVLVAQQTLTWQGSTIKSPPTSSLPAEFVNAKEKIPAPQIQAPILACDTAVAVLGLLDGATFTLTQQSGPTGTYEYFGNAVWALTAPLHVPDGVSVVQEFRTCHLTSPTAGPVPVTKVAKLPAPVIQGPLCADSRLVAISNLRPGATVSILAGRKTGPNSEQFSASYMATAGSETQTFALPAKLGAGLSGPAEYIWCYQESCGVGSPDSNRMPLGGLAAVPAPKLGQLVECTRLVEVGGLTPGASLRLLSDQADTPVLSMPVVCTTASAVAPTYRSLRAGETVTAVLSGCGAGPGSQSSRKVDALSTLNPPVVHRPTRVWQAAVRVDKCLPGARVHLFVNKRWRASADAVTDTVLVPCGQLKVEDQLTAIQTLCTRISGTTDKPVPVDLGQLKVSVTPSPIIKSPNPSIVTVLATDVDDGHAVAGLVTLPQQVTQPTNTPFAWTFPPGQPAPTASVTVDGYASSPVSWPLQEPPQPKAATLTLDFANNAPEVTVTKVEWAVATMGAGNVETNVGSPTCAVAQLPLPTPAQPPQQYYVQCAATIAGVGTARVGNGLCPDGSGRAVVGWSGTALTAHFRLYSTQAYDPSTGQVVPVYTVQYMGAA